MRQAPLFVLLIAAGLAFLSLCSANVLSERVFDTIIDRDLEGTAAVQAVGDFTINHYTLGDPTAGWGHAGLGERSQRLSGYCFVYEGTCFVLLLKEVGGLFQTRYRCVDLVSFPRVSEEYFLSITNVTIDDVKEEHNDVVLFKREWISGFSHKVNRAYRIDTATDKIEQVQSGSLKVAYEE
jgi:hypothetical protein